MSVDVPQAASRITVFSPARIAGQVAFPRNPAHRPVLHLCEGWRLVGSRLAGARLEEVEDGHARPFEFVAEEMGLQRFSADKITIVVAETGERLVEPANGTGTMTVEELLLRGSRTQAARGRTFEDALAFGYCAQDVLHLLFQDFLGRGCEPETIQGWERALGHRSTVADIVETLLASAEYAERRLSLGSLPGRIFDNDLLYLCDRDRMRELQDATLARPIRDAMVDVSVLAALDLPAFIDGAFRLLLLRPADRGALGHFSTMHTRAGWTRLHILETLIASVEFDARTVVGGFDALVDAGRATV